jgi:hypothetical protein
MPIQRQSLDFDPAGRPVLLVTVDTEAEFDWDAPLTRQHRGVASVAHQDRAQRIFAAHGVTPTYLLDYAVVEDAAACRILAGALADGACEIGSHLNPWLTPPFVEDLTPAHSFAGNLPPEVERAKLVALSEAIETRLGRRPRVYRAGRYGLGPNTPALLGALGYAVDMSLAPGADFAGEGGPDFTAFDCAPFWFGPEGRLLELPMTWGFAGPLAVLGAGLYPWLAGRFGNELRLPGLLARGGLLEYVRLTPEGEKPAALRRLTRTLLARGQRVFSLTYHSPSLVPGNTPYVRDRRELEAFLATLDGFLAFFLGDLGGVAMTPLALYERCAAGSPP